MDESTTTTRRKRLPIAMTMKEAESIAGTLGHPSKMPGWSYGISAWKCQTGSKLRGVVGSTCSVCFARTNWYATWRPLLEGHARRWNGLSHPRWVDAMVAMITQKCQPPHQFFRWHDSGDLQSVWHLDRIVQVCERTPDVKHWLPTREYFFVAGFLATDKTVPPNLCIRLSAHMIDCEPVLPPELAGFPVSTVSSVPLVEEDVQIVEGKGSIECRAVEVRDNKCGECRACWDRRVKSVNYPQH